MVELSTHACVVSAYISSTSIVGFVHGGLAEEGATRYGSAADLRDASQELGEDTCCWRAMLNSYKRHFKEGEAEPT